MLVITASFWFLSQRWLLCFTVVLLLMALIGIYWLKMVGIAAISPLVILASVIMIFSALFLLTFLTMGIWSKRKARPDCSVRYQANYFAVLYFLLFLIASLLIVACCSYLVAGLLFVLGNSSASLALCFVFLFIAAFSMAGLLFSSNLKLLALGWVQLPAKLPGWLSSAKSAFMPMQRVEAIVAADEGAASTSHLAILSRSLDLEKNAMGAKQLRYERASAIQAIRCEVHGRFNGILDLFKVSVPLAILLFVGGIPGSAQFRALADSDFVKGIFADRVTEENLLARSYEPGNKAFNELEAIQEEPPNNVPSGVQSTAPTPESTKGSQENQRQNPLLAQQNGQSAGKHKLSQQVLSAQVGLLKRSGPLSQPNQLALPDQLNQSGLPSQPNQSASPGQSNQSGLPSQSNQSGLPSQPNQPGPPSQPNQSAPPSQSNQSGPPSQSNQSWPPSQPGQQTQPNSGAPTNVVIVTGKKPPKGEQAVLVDIGGSDGEGDGQGTTGGNKDKGTLPKLPAKNLPSKTAVFLKESTKTQGEYSVIEGPSKFVDKLDSGILIALPAHQSIQGEDAQTLDATASQQQLMPIRERKARQSSQPSQRLPAWIIDLQLMESK